MWGRVLSGDPMQRFMPEKNTPAAIESENGSLGSWCVWSKHQGLLGAFLSVQNPKVATFCL